MKTFTVHVPDGFQLGADFDTDNFVLVDARSIRQIGSMFPANETVLTIVAKAHVLTATGTPSLFAKVRAALKDHDITTEEASLLIGLVMDRLTKEA